MVAYVDSSAAVKLAHHETHSTELVSWLQAQPDLTMISSVLIEVELSRALHRYDPAALPNVPAVLARMIRVEMHSTIRAIASTYAQAALRSLDAIHLATAQYVTVAGRSQIDIFVAYDSRLLAFAQAQGFTAVGPT